FGGQRPSKPPGKVLGSAKSAALREDYPPMKAAMAKEKRMDNYHLWGRIISSHRIDKSETVEIEEGGIETASLEICRRFDVQRPLQLPKHTREFEQFGRTFYAPEHFTEPVSFQKLEIELLLPEGAKKSSGRRTPLMDA